MTVGIVGLGNMGSALAENLVGAGHAMVALDLAGAERCPDGATFADSLEGLARCVTTVVLSLPDGSAVEAVADGLAPVEGGTVRHVVDTSTVGVVAAGRVASRLADHGVAYLDAPVSGGPAGARARTLAVMYAGADDVCAAVEPVLAGLSDRRRRVGDRPGMGQAVKLLNNFLSATALAATSEAMAFAEAVGLDPATVIEVLNGASGRSSATEDKFPNHVLTGRYASGFASALMAKDLGLYLEAVEAHGTPSTFGRLTGGVWDAFSTLEPEADFTRIHPFVAGGGAAGFA